MRWMGLAVIAAAACGSSKDSSSASGGSASASGEPRSCAQRADELGAWTTSIAREGAASMLVVSDQLLESSDAPIPPKRDWVDVAVHRTAIQVGLDEVTSAEALSQHLADERAMVEQAGRSASLLLVIDRDAPARKLAIAAAGAMSAGFTTASFAFVRKPTVSPPPRSSVSDAIDAATHAEAHDRASALMRAVVPTINSCPALAQAFARVPSSEDSGASFASSIGPAVAACDCKLDLDALRSVTWAVFGPVRGPPVGVLDVTLAAPDDADAVVITGATWADMAPAVIAAKGKPVGFAAR